MEKPEGIGDTARRLLRMGATNREALDGVLRAHPDAKTTMKCIRWYRHHLLKDFDAPPARDAPGLPPDALEPPSEPARESRGPPPRARDREAGERGLALALTRDLLRRWRTNEQVRTTVLEAYPGARVTGADVRAARSELRNSRGEYVPTSAEARRFQAGEPLPTDPAPPASVLRGRGI